MTARWLLQAAGLAIGTSSAAAPAPRCALDVAALTAPRLFTAYPAAASRSHRWVAPDVRRGEAHLFRTALRRAAAGPPDFAGRWRVAWIGCGAAAVCPAFIDRTNGRVVFPKPFRVVAALSVNAGDESFDMLTYRPDSRLLLVLGAPDEDTARTGASYYDWRDGAPSLVRFVPVSALCAGKGSGEWRTP